MQGLVDFVEDRFRRVRSWMRIGDEPTTRITELELHRAENGTELRSLVISSRVPAPETTPRGMFITDLPTEILLAIKEHLTLGERFVTSQTCRNLREVMACTRPWRDVISDLVLPHRLFFFHTVATCLPDYCLCMPCRRLHCVSRHWDIFVSKSPGPVPRSPGQNMAHLGRRHARFYDIGHAHVQLALKYARFDFGDPYRALYRELMSPYRTFDRIAVNLYMKYTAVPRIVNGRFLLRETWEIESVGGPVDLTYMQLHGGNVELCPHRQLLDSSQPQPWGWLPPSLMRRRAAPSLGPAGWQAVMDAGIPVCRFCPQCGTDFMLQAFEAAMPVECHHPHSLGTPFGHAVYGQLWHRSNPLSIWHYRARGNRQFVVVSGSLVITAWKDMGGLGTAPWERNWKAHVWAWRMWGPRVPHSTTGHVFGSSRAMFEAGELVGAPGV
jgi:hypothetical protein